MLSVSEDRQSSAISPGYTVVGHGGEGGGGHTVIGPNGEIADGIADAIVAVRTARQHAGLPVSAPEPAHTLTLPVSCTVEQLRRLLRQLPGTARLADVRILGADVAARLTHLTDVEMRFVGGAK